MNKALRFFMIPLCFSTFTGPLWAELLIVKQDKNGIFVPLDDSDAENNFVIVDILTKYQWPMCIARASELTSAEKEELFTARNPNREEEFIQRKLREALPGSNYSVVFIPTAIYELFCVWQLIKTVGTRGSLEAAVKINIETGERINLLDDSGKVKAQADIDEIYKTTNSYFINQNLGSKNPSFFINSELAKMVLGLIGKVSFSDSADFSNKIEGMRDDVVDFLISEIQESEKSFTPVALNKLLKYNSKFFKDLHWETRKFSQHLKGAEILDTKKINLIKKVVNLEYEARSLNKALLLRATGLTKGTFQERLLAGDALNVNNKHFYYSVSFGNSLFAGCLQDPGACVYRIGIGVDRSNKILGYAVYIDKEDYINTRCDNLFFIAATTPIAGIFQRGEYFHSRTTVAIIDKDQEVKKAKGLGSMIEIKDPNSIFFIRRRPVFQAELFSQFLANNIRLIKSDNNIVMTPEEITFADEIKNNQRDASVYYKTTGKFVRLIHARRQKKAAAMVPVASE